MSVNKINGYAAPYRSKLFRDEANTIINRNGITAMSGKVATVGPDVVIPPFTLSQQGLLYSSDANVSITIPGSLEAPYYLTVSAVTPVNVDDLFYQFVDSPERLTDNQVILAEWDGVSWRSPKLVSIDGVISQNEKAIVASGKVGPVSGLTTSIVGPNYVNSSGALVDKQGVLTDLDGSFIAPVIATDPDWDRVDRLIFRRPTDYAERIGVRELSIGGTYSDGGPETLYGTTIASSANPHQEPLVLVASDNSVHFLYAQGYGASFTIKYQKYDSTRQTQLVAATTVTTTTSPNFSAVLDSAGNIHLAYTVSGVLKWRKLSSVGASVAGPTTVDSKATPSDFPQLAVDPFGLKVFFIYQNAISGATNQIIFATLALSGAVVTAPITLTSGVNNLIHPSICVTNDLQTFIAYEDQTNGKIYYISTNDIGTITTTAQHISGATDSTSYGTLIDQASYPIIKVSDNQSLFVGFLQKKSLSLVGVTVYNDGAAYLQDLISPSENILDYDMVVDSTNNDVNITASQAARVDFTKLNNTNVVLTVPLEISGTAGVSLKKDIFGSLIHTYVGASPGTYTNAGSAEAVSNIGPAAVAGTLNPLVLSNVKFSMLAVSTTYIPVVGDRVTLSGSVNGNNVARIVVAVALQSINASNDTYVVTVDSAFPASETPAVAVNAQFAQPNGNAVKFIKSVGELSLTRGLSTDELSTDILLSRLVFPGPTVLNYIPPSGPGINSDVYGMYGAINVDWSATTANALTMTSGLRVINLLDNKIYTVAGGTFSMVDGDALYIVMDGVTTSITPQISQIGSLPWGLPIQVLGFVKAGEFNPHLFSVAGMGELEVGESIVLGQEISNNLKTRLGVINDITYEAYTSTNIIGSTDSYPAALSELDTAVNTILTQTAQEETFIVGAGGQSLFTLSTITFSSSHAIPDIQVTRSGQKVGQSPDGTPTNYDFIKVGTNQIQFGYTLPENAKVIVRKERTGGVGVGGSDLTNITVDPQPITNAAHSLGTVSKAWSGVFLKDTSSSQVYRLDITGGVITATPVP